MQNKKVTISSPDDIQMKDDTVYFVPLGGCGVFGCNMSLYGYKGEWIMVDCGMGFADDNMPGVDILLPDPSFAEKLGKSLLAIVITHSHEDHIGGLQHIWPRLKAPLYATPFSYARLRQDFNETPWGGQVKMYEVPPRGRLDIGPFKIDMIKMAHSIPEGRALAIEVKGVGRILHTGDWKTDPDPVEGDRTDEESLRDFGKDGVLAVIGDSTNAAVPGVAGSEREVQKNMTDLFREFRGQIVVTCFSTSVARLHAVYTAAKANNRVVSLVGRSLWQVYEAAKQTGYLKDIPPFLEPEEAEFLPAERIVYICTGSQGEPRAALTRISKRDHKFVALGEGDVVIFSSRVIPGNEKSVNTVKNNLMMMGVEVVTADDARVHVSGHAYRDEIRALYSWVKPKAVIPVHGERYQLERHAQLATDCGATHAPIPDNGDVFAINAEGVKSVGHVKCGLLAIEGNRIVAVEHEAIQSRKRIMWQGSAVVTVVIDGKGGLLSHPQITALGLLDDECEIDSVHLDKAEDMLAAKIKNMPRETRMNDDDLAEEIRVILRRHFNDLFGRKPQTRVHLVRI